jgi:hypothetical protein
LLWRTPKLVPETQRRCCSCTAGAAITMYFAPQQKFFGTTRRTVAVDLRCHGASDAPRQEYTVADFADDLAWQCRLLELKKPIVVGRSMGGTAMLLGFERAYVGRQSSGPSMANRSSHGTKAHAH